MKVSNTEKRLKELMEMYDYKQSDLVARTGLDKSTISYYVNGKREPAQDNIFIIAGAFDIEPAWLMGYDVPMRKESIEHIDIKDNYSDNVADLFIKIQHNEILLNIVNKISKLDNSGLAIINHVVNAALDRKEQI